MGCRGCRPIWQKEAILNQYNAENTMVKSGSQLLNFDGVETLFNIPHGMPAVPDGICFTFQNTTESAILEYSSSVDAENIIIQFSVAPTTPTSVWWVAVKN